MPAWRIGSSSDRSWVVNWRSRVTAAGRFEPAAVRESGRSGPLARSTVIGRQESAVKLSVEAAGAR